MAGDTEKLFSDELKRAAADINKIYDKIDSGESISGMHNNNNADTGVHAGQVSAYLSNLSRVGGLDSLEKISKEIDESVGGGINAETKGFIKGVAVNAFNKVLSRSHAPDGQAQSGSQDVTEGQDRGPEKRKG